MFAVLSCLEQHNLVLVGWAAVICVGAAAASLMAYRRAIATQGGHRLAWVLIFALLLGSGVWSTHFMAVLAYHQDLQIYFGTALTAASFVAAVLGAAGGAAVAAIRRTLAGRIAGGAICGGAVAVMHFTGVEAMRLPAMVVWDPVLVTASVVIGVGVAAAAFAVAGPLHTVRRGAATVGLLVLAICGLHFTAMGAITLVPSDLPLDSAIGGLGGAGRRDLALGVGLFVVMIFAAGAGMLAMDRFGVRSTFSSLRAVLNSAPSGVASFDAEGRMAFWNETFADIMAAYGMAAGRGLALEAIAAIGMEPAAQAGGVEITAPDGRVYQTRTRADGAGGFVVVMTDVTEIVELSRREVELRHAAEASNRAKSEFLANMSHEIRTPLNGVLGMVQVMGANPLSRPQRSRLEVIGEAGKTLLTVLNSVLDLSKIEAGKVELEAAPFDVAQTLQTAAAAYAPMAAAKGLAFEIDIDPACRGAWTGDAARLTQVVNNLVSNALKFTEAGSVRVRVAPSREGLAFQVTDTGVGIAAESLELVFDKFTQADASTTRRYGGTGLGLAICRHLVQLMGGELTVTSRLGQGSIFAFALPLTRAAEGPAAAPAKAAPAAASETPLRILAAEDNPTNRLVLAALLEPLGVQLTLAETGREAVEAFAPGRFDLILMDIQMPELSGDEAAAEIRAQEAAKGLARTPIVALTANVMEHQLRDYRAAGMDGHVSKPINAASLFEAIERALSPPEAAAAAEEADAA